MDNLCHTLAGAALGEAGLKNRTRFGMPILLIASNLPDIDVFAFLLDTPAVAVRRGWTHGLLGQLLLPLALTGVLPLVDRLRPAAGAGPRFRTLPALLLSCLGLVSHVVLDWLNPYGVRLLKPLSERWFYGDAVFIIDPWLWFVLALGVFIARRSRRRAAAVVAVAVASAYVTGMVWSARAARAQVLDLWVDRAGRSPRALMVGPYPFTPLIREVIIDDGEEYLTGRFEVATRRLELDRQTIARNEHHPAAIRAREDPAIRAVLVWARFPFYHLTPVEGGTVVAVGDVRFAARVGGIRVFVPD